jgi:hypothetical protein
VLKNLPLAEKTASLKVHTTRKIAISSMCTRSAFKSWCVAGIHPYRTMHNAPRLCALPAVHLYRPCATGMYGPRGLASLNLPVVHGMKHALRVIYTIRSACLIRALRVSGTVIFCC